MHEAFPSMIELKNVDAIKSGCRLFNNFSWRIGPGEHWVICGNNGCGKTTLLEIISGAVHIPKGEVHFSFIEGSSWDERYAERRRKIHYIPAHAIQSFLSETQGLYYQQRYYGIGDEMVHLVRDMLGENVSALHSFNIPESLSIQHLLDLDITKLSNGQLKKVLLLRVLLAEPPQFLLLDYPFEGLDTDSRKDLCDFIDFIATELGIQVIIVDHYHQLPRVINRRLTLNNFDIVSEELYSASKPNETTQPSTHITTPPLASGMPVIDIRNLRIQYRDHVVLDNFSWIVNQGERWALIGRNGMGKTTLFSMIFADHPLAYSQEIYLFGRRRGTGESIWDIKRRIAYMGPELVSYLAPKSIGLSARDYIRSVNRKMDENSLNLLVAHFNAQDFVDKPVRVLSSGQLQIMLIMNCFLTQKELLLLDEPFQFLDARQRESLNSYLHTHLKGETTLILITHYAEDLTEWTNHTKVVG